MAMSDDGTKIGASRRYIMSAVEDSLRPLDWIDLYQLHQPDPLTPLDETMQALDDLVTQGKIRYRLLQFTFLASRRITVISTMG